MALASKRQVPILPSKTVDGSHVAQQRRPHPRDSVDRALALANRPTKPVDNKRPTKKPSMTNKSKTMFPRDYQYVAYDKENSTDMSSTEHKQHLMNNCTNKHDAFDADDVNAAFQLLTLKTKPPAKSVRFSDTVQVCEYKRCFNHACFDSIHCLGLKPPMKYALAIDWTIVSEYTTRMNIDQAASFGQLSALSLEERCRLLAQHLSVPELAQDVAQQRGKTTARVNLSIEKQLTDFLAGKIAKPP